MSIESFNNLSSLSTSFFDRSGCTDINKETPCIDWISIINTIKENETRIKEKLRNWFLSPSLLHISEIKEYRALFIVIQLPLWFTGDFNDITLLAAFIDLSISNQKDHYFIKWFESSIEIEHLRNVLQMYQNCLSNHINSKTGKLILSPFDRLLQLLIKANKYRRSFYLSFFDYKLYYNDKINQEFKISTEYQKWKDNLSDSYIKRVPFLLNTQNKSQVLAYSFQENRNRKLQSAYIQHVIESKSEPNFVLTINRSKKDIIGQSIKQINETINKNILQRRLKVVFFNEDVIDLSGSSGNYFDSIITEFFNPDYGLFIYNKDNDKYHINPLSSDEKEYHLFGMILALAIYNGFHLNLSFPIIFYTKLYPFVRFLSWVDNISSLIDLVDYDKALYKLLVDFKALQTNEEIAAYSLYNIYPIEIFGETYQYNIFTGKQVVDEKEWEEIDTIQKRDRFLHQLPQFLTNQLISKQFQWIYNGFHYVLESVPLWDSLLDAPEELELLLCGSKVIDLHETEKHTRYDNGYTKDSLVIKWFWSIVHQYGQEQKQDLVRYITGVPQLGISGYIKLVINRGGSDIGKLPVAHTCFATLDLFDYASYDRLEYCLKMMIDLTKGDTAFGDQ